MVSGQPDFAIHALVEFLEAYETLRDLWDEHNLNDLQAIEYYPFELSFDELDIPFWVKAMVKELRK